MIIDHQKLKKDTTIHQGGLPGSENFNIFTNIKDILKVKQANEAQSSNW